MRVRYEPDGGYYTPLCHTVTLDSKRARRTTRMSELHEFAHANQDDRGYLSSDACDRHRLFTEAEASAAALIWTDGYYFRRYAEALRLNWYRKHLPVAYEGNMRAYLRRHISRIQRKWAHYQEARGTRPR